MSRSPPSPTDAPAATDARIYPNLELFLETATDADVAVEFADTRARLQKLPTSQAHQATKALAALDKAEALLHRLFAVKASLQQAARGARSIKHQR